jgi:hypothetical protein
MWLVSTVVGLPVLKNDFWPNLITTGVGPLTHCWHLPTALERVGAEKGSRLKRAPAVQAQRVRLLAWVELNVIKLPLPFFNGRRPFLAPSPSLQSS